MDQRRRLVDVGLVQRQRRVRPPVDRGHAAFRDQQWADLAERAAWDACLTPAVAYLMR